MAVPFGEILRQWREARGLSLEAAAHNVEILALAKGIPENSKKVPRTHASLSRWETGKVEIKEIGLELLAAAYGTTPEDIRRPPPAPGAPPTRTVEVRGDHAQAVEAFIETLERNAR